jgi:hypothetical protein
MYDFEEEFNDPQAGMSITILQVEYSTSYN